MLTDWCKDDSNKNTIYHISVCIWVFLFTTVGIMLPFNTDKDFRVYVYVILVMFIPLFYIVTIWMLRSAFNAFHVALRSKYNEDGMKIGINETDI